MTLILPAALVSLLAMAPLPDAVSGPGIVEVGWKAPPAARPSRPASASAPSPMSHFAKGRGAASVKKPATAGTPTAPTAARTPAGRRVGDPGWLAPYATETRRSHVARHIGPPAYVRSTAEARVGTAKADKPFSAFRDLKQAEAATAALAARRKAQLDFWNAASVPGSRKVLRADDLGAITGTVAKRTGSGAVRLLPTRGAAAVLVKTPDGRIVPRTAYPVSGGR